MSELLRGIVQIAMQRGASDIHLVAGSPPTLRVTGEVVSLGGQPLTDELIRSMLFDLLTEERQRRLAQGRGLDLAWEAEGLVRLRCSVFLQRETLSASFRLIPSRLPDARALGLPVVVDLFARRHQGLVLVTGATGSGKSSTMAVMVDMINADRAVRILTIEDPIEFVHPPRRASVIQREIGSDARSFHEALREALRQDPDVIVVGEMRDPETISVALTAAETGHLVVSTLHTRSAADTIQRIVDVFPADQQPAVRTQLAGSLIGVLSQRLLPRADGKGRCLAFEVMTMTDSIRHMVREGAYPQIPGAIVTGKKVGMIPMDHCLRWLHDAGKISRETAVAACADPAGFDSLTAVGAPALLV